MIKCFPDYCLDEQQLSLIREDGRIEGCWSAAAKAQQLGAATFSTFDWVRFLWWDFCASVFCCKAKRFSILSQEIAPALIQKIAKTNRFVAENFCAMGNVCYLEEADVVGLGEIHSSEGHRRNNAALIDALAKEGDLALVEAHFEGRRLPPDSTQTKHVASKIQIQGWDLKHRFDPYPHLRRIDAAAALFGLVALWMNAWLLAIPILFLYRAEQSIKQRVIRELSIRDENMCQMVDDHSKGKLFVTAGRAHFASKRVIGCFGKKKFAILQPAQAKSSAFGRFLYRWQ